MELSQRNNLLGLINETPWLVSEKTMGDLPIIIEAQVNKTSVPRSTGVAPYEVVDGTAIIDVYGIISQRPDIFSWLFGGAVIETIAGNFSAALDDPAVKSILLNIDSPGGAVNGTSGLSDLIYNSRGKKPIIAVANSTILSAAYWIASAADKIYMASGTSQCGSIGVVARHVDISKSEEMAGIKTTEIYAGKYKTAASPYEPLTVTGRETLQGMVDYIYGLFVEAVARNRGVKIEDVIKNMADGRVFIGQQAIDAGLVDRVATIDEVVKSLAGGGNQKTGGIRAMAEPTTATEKPQEITAESLRREHPALIEAIVASATTAAMATGYESGKIEGAAAERVRIGGIGAITMTGFEALMDAFIADGKTSPADAALQQTVEMKKRGITVEQIMADSPPPVSFNPMPGIEGGSGELPDDYMTKLAERESAKGGV